MAKKWSVYGVVQISAIAHVEAETAEEAMELAADEWPGMTNYAGNGGIDQLVGLCGGDYGIEADDSQPEWISAEEDND